MDKNNKDYDGSDLPKSRSHVMVDTIDYIPNAIVIKTIIKRASGNISLMSFDEGESLLEKTSPFDSFVQVIEGKAEIVIDSTSTNLATGCGIILPAHLPNYIRSNERFKMILTVIKSGYE
ncbi:cupin domain-containing protein [Arcticibacter sp.]|jgi:quercetin dioxygenase-like cupin family protein|uniref:cupin domain-containing protein n=1 Tax=Arcticibacter sp. TaxID=1872630 RepID=UPI00388F4688